MFAGRGLSDGPIPHPGVLECVGVSECDDVSSTTRRPRPEYGFSATTYLLTYLLTHSLTHSLHRAESPLEKLTGLQLVKKFPAFY
jgi:hypothetical protein